MNIDLYPVFGDKYIKRHRSYIGITMELKKTGRHRQHGFVQSNHSSRPHILFFECALLLFSLEYLNIYIIINIDIIPIRFARLV